MAQVCSIKGCRKPIVNVRGWCKAHYQRWWRHGDPLKQTRLSNGGAERFLRETVLVYDGDDCLHWPHSKGRAMMFRNGRHHCVARIVCSEVHGAPPTPLHQTAHSCGRGHLGCVTKRHLRWATPEENCADKDLHGTTARGRSHGKAALDETAIRAIRAMKGAARQSDIARRFSVSESTISQILLGKTWTWLPTEGGSP